MIYIIVTASVNNKEGVRNAEHRKNTYISCIRQLSLFTQNNPNIKVIIVENGGHQTTYLDEFKNNGHIVVYTNNNQYQCAHKGVNELLDIKQMLQIFNIQDDDIVVKLTGRYKLLNINFLNTVQENYNTHHAFVKFFNVCTKEFMRNDCVLGLFAIRCKYLKKFNYQCNGKSPECEFADYVRNIIPEEKIMEIRNLDLLCCFADDLRTLIV